MENSKVIETGTDTLALKLICNVLQQDAQTVATILNNAESKVMESIIDGILLADSDEAIQNAIELFNTELEASK